ncbi:hypothetical protein HNP12_000221 [Aeromonas hydrophila]|uniref:hypothetical protein n=1 Tax=Aeromonas TaxID=642 RepID=UPI002168B29A|nr:hypothetical protein [Aeromonas hydrophila]MCS3766182.1 hypothetical protein [Aeromonas hydrophila]
MTAIRAKIKQAKKRTDARKVHRVAPVTSIVIDQHQSAYSSFVIAFKQKPLSTKPAETVFWNPELFS